MSSWPLPEEMCLKVFSSLNAAELSRLRTVCKQWNRMCKDESLWRRLFYKKHGKIEGIVPNNSWRSEYLRLEEQVPMVESEVLFFHADEVWYVCFSSDGKYFVSCCRDGSFVVWKNTVPAVKTCCVVDMKERGWVDVRHAEFNEGLSHLIVCGFKECTRYDDNAAIAVFEFREEKCIFSHVLCVPYFYHNSTWYNNTMYLTGLDYYDDQSDAGYSFSLNKVGKGGEVTRELTKFVGNYRGNLLLVTTLPSLHPPDEKYLVFAAGFLRRCPDLVCFKKITNNNNEIKNEIKNSIDHCIDLGEIISGMALSPDKNSLYLTTRPWEKSSDPNPNHECYHLRNIISKEVNVRVVDLKTLTQRLFAPVEHDSDREASMVYHYSSPGVSKDYVAVGSTNKFAYVFDRRYAKCVAKLPHKNMVNSLAFNPRDQGMLITACDDKTVRIWRSKGTSPKKTPKFPKFQNESPFHSENEGKKIKNIFLSFLNHILLILTIVVTIIFSRNCY